MGKKERKNANMCMHTNIYIYLKISRDRESTYIYSSNIKILWYQVEKSCLHKINKNGSD